MLLREDDEETCMHPGWPTARDNYREVNGELSTVRPSETSDCIRVAIRPEPPGPASAYNPFFRQDSRIAEPLAISKQQATARY
jgi:hypothetical protein